jgi:hypothetical protein
VSRLSEKQRKNLDRLRRMGGYLRPLSHEEAVASLRAHLGHSASLDYTDKSERDLVTPGTTRVGRSLLRCAVSRGDHCLVVGQSAAVVDDQGRVWAGTVVRTEDSLGLHVWGQDTVLRGALLRLGSHTWAVRHSIWQAQHKGKPLVTLTAAGA